MSVLKRFSNSLGNRCFRQLQPGVITHSAPLNQNQTYGFNDFLTPLSGVCNHSPIHTSQFVVDASFLMDKRLVDEAAEPRYVTGPLASHTFSSTCVHGPSPP